jgi:hypothetical protein
MTSDQFHLPLNQFHMTSDQFLVTSDQFLVTSDQFEMSDDQNWRPNQLVTAGHDWSRPDWSQKPQDPKFQK